MGKIIESSRLSLGALSSVEDLFDVPTRKPIEYTASTTASSVDIGNVVYLTSGSAITYTINAESTMSRGFPLYVTLLLVQGGAGALSVTGGAGVSINGVSTGTVTLSGIGQVVGLHHKSQDNWIAFNQTAS